MEIETMKA